MCNDEKFPRSSHWCRPGALITIYKRIPTDQKNWWQLKTPKNRLSQEKIPLARYYLGRLLNKVLKIVMFQVGEKNETETFIKDRMYLSHGLWTPRESFFFKLETFGLRQTKWAEIFWGIWVIFSQTISTILVLWVPCPWENVAGSFSNKKLWF